MPLNIDWQQILLHALNLSLLVGGLYALLFKPVKHYLDARSEKVETAAQDAAARQAEADRMCAEYETKLQNIDEEIRNRRSVAAAEAEKDAAKLLKSAREQAEQIVTQAKETAAREEKRIVRDAQSEITELSLEATRKLVDCPVSDVYDQFLNSAEGSDANGSAE